MNAKPQSIRLGGKNRRKAVVELSNHEIADETAKQTTMAKRRDERPAKKLSPQSTKKQRLHKKPSVAEDNEERKINGLNEQPKNSKNPTVKEWSKG